MTIKLMIPRNEKGIATWIIRHAFMAFIISAGVNTRADEQHPVSLLVSELSVQRIGNVLFRHIEFFEEYPCLRLETIRPITHELIDRVEACVFSLDEYTIDVRRDDLAGVGYRDHRLENNVFRFTADIILGGPGPGIPPLNCKVTVSIAGTLSGPSCTELTEK